MIRCFTISFNVTSDIYRIFLGLDIPFLMMTNGTDVWRMSSGDSRRPTDVIFGTAILDTKWRRRKWRQPRPGAAFSTPIDVEVENGGTSASVRHLGWSRWRNRETRSSKMAAGNGRAPFYTPLQWGSKRPPYTTSSVHYGEQSPWNGSLFRLKLMYLKGTSRPHSFLRVFFLSA